MKVHTWPWLTTATVNVISGTWSQHGENGNARIVNNPKGACTTPLVQLEACFPTELMWHSSGNASFQLWV